MKTLILFLIALLLPLSAGFGQDGSAKVRTVLKDGQFGTQIGETPNERLSFFGADSIKQPKGASQAAVSSGPVGKVVSFSGIASTGTCTATGILTGDVILDVINLTEAHAEKTSATLTTAISGSQNDLIFTAATAGTAGNAVSVEYAISGTASTPLSVGVTGNAVRVVLATGTSGTITSTGSSVLAIITSSTAASALVTGTYAAGNDGTGTVAIMERAYLTGGLEHPFQSVATLDNKILYSGTGDISSNRYLALVEDTRGRSLTEAIRAALVNLGLIKGDE